GAWARAPGAPGHGPRDPRKGQAVDRGAVTLDRLGQAILPRHEVVHVGIRTILRAAADGDEAAMAELVDVVLDAPHAAGLAGQLRANLAGDDLVGHTGARDQRRAVEVDDHAFAHRVEGAVGAAHADVRRVPEITERVGLIGHTHAMAGRGRVYGRPQHDVGAFVGALPGHLREHTLVAADPPDLAAVRPLADRDAEIARLPRLDRRPRV